MKDAGRRGLRTRNSSKKKTRQEVLVGLAEVLGEFEDTGELEGRYDLFYGLQCRSRNEQTLCNPWSYMKPISEELLSTHPS